jgi:hypothetical protein
MPAGSQGELYEHSLSGGPIPVFMWWWEMYNERLRYTGMNTLYVNPVMHDFESVTKILVR